MTRLHPPALSFSCRNKKPDRRVKIILIVIDMFFLFENVRYFNVIGSDPEGRLGEAPRPELREHGRISGACFDAARGIMSGLKVC
jgi:hypothetical protein